MLRNILHVNSSSRKRMTLVDIREKQESVWTVWIEFDPTSFSVAP